MRTFSAALLTDAADGGTLPVCAPYEYGRCTSSVMRMTAADAVDGGALPVCPLYEYGGDISSNTPLANASCGGVFPVGVLYE